METKKKILVVDDDPTLVLLVERILKEKGFDVVTADNGIDAMRAVNSEKPDLLVLDIMMPEINGYDICRTLKFESPHRDLPIVIVTSRDQELDPRIGAMLGIEYIHKPVDREALLAKIKQMLKIA